MKGYVKYAFISSLGAFGKMRKGTVMFIMSVRWELLNSH